MNILIITLTTLITTLSFANSSCERAAEAAAEDKFRNHEFGCYGHARQVKNVSTNTMHVTVDAVGGNGSCTRKVFEVKFKGSERSCAILSVKRLGSGGV